MSSAGGAPGAGTVACWGLNHLGRTNVPAGLRGVTHVTAGSSYTCAGTGDGALTCWGATGDGPASVPAGMTGVAQVSTLESHTCAVTIAGGVACWGRGFSGQTTVPAPYALTLRVAPAGAFGVAPAAPDAGEPVTLTLDGAQVPGYPAATTFTYAFDCGDGQGYGAFGAAATRTCPAAGAGPRTFRGAVRDQDGDTREYAAVVTVADPTPPVVTPTLTGLLGNNGWYRGDVAVSWAAADAQSGISALSGCGQTAVTADTPGLTLTCSATSAGGTGTGTVTVKRDATPPALCAAVAPAVVLQHAGAAASATATDALSGLAGPAACGPVSTATPGARQVTCTAGDNAGNVASVAAAYTVVSVTLAVQPNAALDRNPGAVAVTGTAACSGAVAVPVSVTLAQTVRSGRATRTVSGIGQGSARCTGGGAAPWTATVAGAFDRGAASAVATVVGTTPAVQSPATAVRVK